jgi:DNA-binding transcriptional ArsR family regulator
MSTLSPEVQEKFFALGEPVRLNIVQQLAEGPKTAGELAEPFSISRPAISRHLRVLREAGIAKAEVRGREWWYSIEAGTLRDTQQWLEDLQAMTAEALLAFKNYVEDQE